MSAANAGVGTPVAAASGPGGMPLVPPPPSLTSFQQRTAGPQPNVASAAVAMGRLQMGGHGQRTAPEEEVMTPTKPSAKALGKRRAVETEDQAGV